MNIREIRKSLNLTQAQFGEKLGLGERGKITVSDWETGKKNISQFYKDKIESIVNNRIILEKDSATTLKLTNHVGNSSIGGWAEIIQVICAQYNYPIENVIEDLQFYVSELTENSDQ